MLAASPATQHEPKRAAGRYRERRNDVIRAVRRESLIKGDSIRFANLADQLAASARVQDVSASRYSFLPNGWGEQRNRVQRAACEYGDVCSGAASDAHESRTPGLCKSRKERGWAR